MEREIRKFYQFLLDREIVQEPYDMESFDQYICQGFLSGSHETQAVRPNEHQEMVYLECERDHCEKELPDALNCEFCECLHRYGT